MGIFKMLRESSDTTISVERDDQLLNGLSRQTKMTMQYSALVAILGEPIQLPQGSEPKIAWVVRVAESQGDDASVVAIVPDSLYHDHIDTHQMDQWSILASTPYSALLVKVGLAKPHDTHFNV